MKGNNKMTKKNLVKAVSEKTGFTMDNSELAVTAAIEAISEAMSNFESVQLRGIGVFTPVIRAPRKTLLPSSDKYIDVPERKAYRFKLSETVKKKLNFDERDLY